MRSGKSLLCPAVRRYALPVMDYQSHSGAIRKLATLMAALMVMPLQAFPAVTAGVASAQDKKPPSTKKKPSAKKSSAAAQKRPAKRPSSASSRRRTRPRPKRKPLKVLAPQEWRALAREISLANAALSLESRRTALQVTGLTRPPQNNAVRRYRNPGDGRRIQRLLLHLEAQPEDLNTLRSLADIERRNHRYDKTVRYLLRALSVQPLNQDLHMILARQYSLQGRYGQALSVYQEVVYLNAEHPEARLAQGQIMDLQGNFDAATAILEEVQLLQGRTAPYFYYHCLHLAATGDYRLAIQTATDGLSSHPDESRLYQARGAAYALLGITDKATIDYYDALALKGNNVDVLRLLGHLSEQERHIEAAIRSYGQILDNEPGDQSASLGLGRSLLRDLQLPAAIEELSTFTALHGETPAANELLAQAYYLSAIQASEMRDYHRALVHQAEARKRAEAQASGWTVAALLWAGEAEWSHGRQRHAASYYQLAVDMNPFNARGHMGLALAYEAMGESARAGWHLQEAERLESRPSRTFSRISDSLP